MARKLSPRTLLHRVLGAASVPVYVVDQHRHVVFCNSACADWLGVADSQLLGTRCDYHSSPARQHHEELAAALCPPPEAFAGHYVRAEIQVPGRPAESARWAEFLPLSRDTDSAAAVLVWVGWPECPAQLGWAAEGWEGESAALHRRLRRMREDERERQLISQTVGRSPAMVRVREQVRMAASVATRVLLVGPPGSGKEHVARSIHYAPDSPERPLVPLDCGLLDAEQLESTVVAFMRHAAEFESLSRGSLLLLDVERLSSRAQTTLLGLLGTREFELRTICTSSVRLESLLGEEGFLAELAYQLSTLVIELPPLSDRVEDIPLLAQMFLERHNAQGGKQLSGLSSEALDALAAYDWPGNVDELGAVVERACRAGRGPWLAPEDLPEELTLARRAADRKPRPEQPIELDAFLMRIESELFRRALRQAKGNKSKASRLLGLNRARFHRRLQQLGLDT